MRKANRDAALLERLRALALERAGDDRPKILGLAVYPLRDVGHARPLDDARRKEPIQIGLSRRDEAIGRHQDRTVELFKLGPLMPPGAAIVPNQMVILFQRRIGIGRQHLAMGIDVHTCPPGLLQEFLQIAQVMSADEDGRPFHNAQVDLRGLRVPVSLCVSRIQERHGAHTHLAGPHHKLEQPVRAGAGLRSNRERLLHEHDDLRVRLAQHARMFIVGGHALEADDQELTQ